MEVYATMKSYTTITIEDEPITIVDSCSAFIKSTDKKYEVHAEYTGEHDTYIVDVYDITNEEEPITLAQASMDSCGGGFGDELLETGIEELDNLIAEELFGKNGIIMPF